MKLRVSTTEVPVEQFELVKLAIEPLKKLCEERGTKYFKIDVPMRPPSVNHYKSHNKAGRYYLDPKTIHFQKLMLFQWLKLRMDFKPTGVVYFVIVVESTHWVTKKFEHRAWDIDNVPKVVLDSFKKATEIDDSLAWGNTSLKVPSKEERTHLFVFDLGDVVQMKK